VTLDSDNYLVINDEVISGFTVAANDSDGSLIDAINAIANDTGVIARLDEDLNLVLEAEDGRNIEVEVFGNAANLNVAADTYAGSITLQSRKAINMVQTDDGAERLGIYNDANGGTTILGVNSQFAVDKIDVTSRTGANQAMDILDVALDQVSLIRSDLGAIQNRLQNTVNNLTVTSENVTAARSRIQDADFAVESAAMSRLQILQQAGTSILAQANQAPNLAMQLLG
jgi:flagellin